MPSAVGYTLELTQEVMVDTNQLFVFIHVWNLPTSQGPFINMDWNYVSIPKFQRFHHWILGMDI